jgi:hypothetical protein
VATELVNCPDCNTPLRTLGDGTPYCPAKTCMVGWQEYGDGELVGKVSIGVPALVYSRVVGYYSPVQQWHEGKKQEFAERLPYQIDA